jgi:hypothetical protein
MDEEIDTSPSMTGVGGLGTLHSLGGDKVLKVGLRYAGELERVV